MSYVPDVDIITARVQVLPVRHQKRKPQTAVSSFRYRYKVARLTPRYLAMSVPVWPSAFIRTAAAEGFEPYSALCSERWKPVELQIYTTPLNLRSPLLWASCGQNVGTDRPAGPKNDTAPGTQRLPAPGSRLPAGGVAGARLMTLGLSVNRLTLARATGPIRLGNC